MSWIKGEEFDFNDFLLTERFEIRQAFGDIGNNCAADTVYLRNMGIALKYNPIVKWYFMKKCPERAEFIAKVAADITGEVTSDEVRKAEIFVIEYCCDYISYANPEIVMDGPNGWCSCIMNASGKARLFELTDFTNKIVLDVGSGAGRFSFAAAEKAAWVYASEPVDTLREFMRDKIKREGIKNMRVVDGIAKELAYPDNTFDIVMSACVIGDECDLEIAEVTRVCKSGGWLLDLESDSNANELVKRSWESMGDSRYRKQIFK